MEKPVTAPQEVIIDFDAKSVIITTHLETAFPQAPAAFQEADEAFQKDPEARLKTLEKGQFSFRSHGADIDCALIPGDGNEMLVIWSPFSDSAPRSTAEDIYEYMTETSNGKRVAAPNSWSQTTKSATTGAVLDALGHNMPVLTIYNVIPSRAYKASEHLQLAKGDFTPSARILSQAITIAQERLHGQGSETQIDTLHIQGSSIGASNAIGSAYANLQSGERAIVSVTAQELIMGPSGLAELAYKFTVGGTRKALFDLVEGQHYQKAGEIHEPTMRTRIDRAGNEPAMVGRMLFGMSKLGRNRGLTHPESNKTLVQLEAISDEGISLLIPLGRNSGITHDTDLYVPSKHVMSVAAIEGQQATHLIDEHVVLTSLATAANIFQSKRNKQS